MSVAEAAAALRTSPSALYGSLVFGYRWPEELAAHLESGTADQRLADAVLNRINAADERRANQEESADYEALGRHLIETLQKYARLNGKVRRAAD